MQAATQPRAIMPALVDVLSVSPHPEDHLSLERLLGIPTPRREWQWHVSTAASLSSALRLLSELRCPVVLCEQHLPLGDWRDLLEHTRQLMKPPFVVVTSRHADDYLWAEALNLGAYDVLAKPFDRAETTRVIELATLRWNYEPQHRRPAALSLRS
jgi:DNA-binding NtrC family response regulator